MLYPSPSKKASSACWLSAFLVPLFFGLSVSLHSATIWWTGEGDGLTWEDAGNWSSETVPGIEDTVWLGYADADGDGVANQPQSITVAGDTMVAQIQVFAEGDRSVTVNGGTFLFATENAATNNPIIVHADAASAVTINSNLQINRRNPISHNGDFELRLGGNISATPQYIPGSDPPVVFPGWNTGSWEFRYTADESGGMGVIRLQGSGSQSVGQSYVMQSGGAIVFDNPLLTTGRVGVDSNVELRFAQIGALGGLAVDANRVASVYREGTSDMFVAAAGGADISGGSSGVVQLVEGDPGQGHLTFQVRRMGGAETIASGGTGIGTGPSIVTAADTTVEIGTHSIARRNLISAADNERISGEGNVRLNMNSAGQVFELYGVLTYTGRTMLETGVLRLMNAGELSWQTGQLPVGTIVEIGSSATLNLNGIDQQVGGVSDYLSSSGELILGGAVLTINSAVDSTFGGDLSGGGTIIKTGAATFTVDGNYTNPVGRTLRVEQGTFAVDGTLSVTDGVFELAGGRVAAATLNANDITWEVILAATAANQQMATVTTANITDSLLALDLDLGYTPAFGTQFTLLYASDSIIGADATNMFGYADGASIFVDGVEFVINWVEGSESIVLTVIPEPGQAAALAGLLALLAIVLLRRR